MEKEDDQAQEGMDAPDPGTSGNTSSGKKKKVYSMEPRTPLKRQRVPVNRFQSPATEEGTTPVTKPPKPNKEEATVLQYKKGVFLAVRGDEGTFYMCRTQQNVYKTTKHFKIQWLDLHEPPNIYKFDFLDATEIECVLTNVKMDRIARETYRLPHSEETRIQNILTKALKKEKGEPVDEDDVPGEASVDEDIVEDEEEDDWEDDEPSAKKTKYSSKGSKPKVTPKSRKSITVSLKGSGSKKSATKSKGKKTEKEKVKKQKKQKKEKKPEKERKRGPDKKLKPNPKIRIVEKDPLFETKDHVPFISKDAHGKLVFRAVQQTDMALLKQLLEDDQHIYSVGDPKSLADGWTALHYALKSNNMEAVGLLAKDIAEVDKDNVRRKLPKPQQLIATISTGTYNPMYLGIRAVRKLTAGRGSKEGNQAFTKEMDASEVYQDIISEAMQMGVNKETLDCFVANSHEDEKDSYNEEMTNNIVFAVLRGHRTLAGKLVDDALNRGGYGFNFLHKDVLVFNDEDLRTFQSASVRKKPFANACVTPLHCSCINPNTKYLEKLLSVEPDISLEDKRGRRPIHYAAACETTGPLEVLLKKGANPNEVTKRMFTPLHFACYAERPKNVDLLLKTAASKAATEGDGGDPMVAKWGIGGINRPNWETDCPIHIAVQSGNVEVVKSLLKHGVDVNKPLSAGQEKLSPLMIAAGKSYLDIARLLIQAGAVVEQLDKYKRTALTHAVMNGSVKVTSYLLYLGADPNRVDSSNNSLVHYAAAYGWYFVLKMLVNEGGADPKKANDWKLTPVGIAFMKAHMGLVDFLLKMPGVEINFKNDSGMTLISIACSSKLSSGLYDQIVYLMEKGSDPSITDANGMNALHHLAANSVKPSLNTNDKNFQKKYDDNMDLTVKIAELLMKAGSNPAVKTTRKQTAVTLAIEKVNTKLVRVLVDKGGVISAEKDEDGANALHHLAQQCMGNDLAPLLKILAQENPLNNIKENGLDEKMEIDSNENGDVKMDVDVSEPVMPMLKKVSSFRSGLEGIKQMVTEVDHNGYTPFLRACHIYSSYVKPSNLKETEVPKVYQNGCDFIRTLIELTGLDVSVTVQKKYQVNDVKTKKSLEDQKKEYDEFGKQSAVHFMVNRGKRCFEGPYYPGLRMILETKPDLELKNLDGKTALAVAVEKQSTEAVEILLAAGANPNASFPLDKETTVTALTTAANLGNTNLVKLLVKAKAQVDCRNSKSKQTPLHLAVANRGKESDAVEMVSILLDGGADLNSVDANKLTPLHLAVNYNTGTSNASTDLEELLIHRGANLFAKDDANRVPLHYTFLKREKPEDSSTLDPVEVCSVLTNAMRGQQVDEVDKNGQTPLHLAAYRGATICCVHLLQRKAEVNRRDKAGNTPLGLAVNKGHDSCAIMLIQKKASVGDKVVINPPEKVEEEAKKPSWKWKPDREVEKDETETYSIFQEAIKQDLQGVAHMVLDNTTLDGQVIEAALRVNKYHVALRLLKRITNPASLHTTNEKCQNLFHVLALYTKPNTQTDLQIKVAKMLFDKGLPVSSLDEHGCTALHYAALKHQHYDLGQFLVENDRAFDVNKKDRFGRTALAAFFWNHEHVMNSASESTNWLKLFLSKGGNFDLLYDYPLSEVPMFDVVTDRVPDYFTTACEHRISPAIFAIHFADFGMLKFLLDNGASPNFADSQGITPIMHAARTNDLSVVKLLLNYSYESSQDTAKKPALVKKASRQVFTIKPLTSMSSVAEEEEEDQSDEDEDEEHDNEEAEEEEEDDDQGEGGDEDQQEEADDDDDHDTDIVDFDEDDEDDAPEKLPSLTRMGSKQVSLLRQGSSVNKEEFLTVEKTSPVDLNTTDNQGWTVIHHLVCPLDYGTYDAEEILYVLWKAGADVLKKDNAGLSPLQHSLIHCASKLSKRLQIIAGVEESKREKPTLATQEVRDSLLLGASTVDYQADAEEMLKTLDSQVAQRMDVADVVKGEDSDDEEEDEDDVVAQPDPNCQIKDVGEVVMDDSQAIPYDVLLSKVDVSHGSWGMYNFYKMQIVWQKGVDIYVLFTRWGRIGDQGQFQHTPFQKKSEAVTEFGKVFRAKTGNYWSNVKSYENQPKKYRLVQREEKKRKEHKIDYSLKSDIPSKLPEPLQNLFKEMTSVNMMTAAVNKVGVDSNLVPFGRIKREALIDSRKLLNQLGDLIKAVTDQKKAGMMTKEDTAAYQGNCEKISKLTSEYYHLIPHHGFTFEKISPIDNYNSLKLHMKALSDLLDLECASKMLLAAQSKLSYMSPLDYIHQALGCKIEPLTEDSQEAQYLLKYIYGSCVAEVQTIYKLSRHKEEERLAATNLDNHKLLFHGSSMANFLSILHRGLLVSPPEVPFTGNLFGEGIYFGDTFCKSKDYCYNTNPESKTKFCLVCEVALGKCDENGRQFNEEFQDLRDTDFNSRHIMGQQRPNPDYDVSLPYGPAIPLGMVQNTPPPSGESRVRYFRQYNEYVIQEPSQICLRYLVQFTDARVRPVA